MRVRPVGDLVGPQLPMHFDEILGCENASGCISSYYFTVLPYKKCWLERMLCRLSWIY